MPVFFKSEEQIVSELVAAFASKIPGLQPYLIPGDPLLAIAEGDATQINFIQALLKAVVKFARASTAEKEDLDSWMLQFGVVRNPAKKAKGQVRLSLNSGKTFNVNVPAGKVIQTLGGAIQYKLVRDPLQTAWNDSFDAYVFPAGQTSIIATAEALEAGSAYNVQPGDLGYIASSGFQADNVVNLQSISNGADAEDDVSLREYFILYINSLSRNTRPSIQAAIMSVQQGIDFNLAENVDQNGNDKDCFFTIVVDDGSGDPPQELLDLIYAAVDEVRGFTIEFTVIKATKVVVTAGLNIKVNPNVAAQPVQTKVKQAIIEYINALKIGQSLGVYNLIGVALNADPNVLNVQVNSAKIDSLELDKTATIFQVIRTIPANVAIGTY